MFELVKLTVVLAPGVKGLGLKLTVDPTGAPVEVKFIGVEKVPCTVVAKVAVAVAVAPQLIFAPAEGVKLNPLAGAVIVKLVFEISKKIFPTDSTLILAVVDGVVGITKASVPSLGVLATSTVGNVKPPSAPNVQFAGLVPVLATIVTSVPVPPPLIVPPSGSVSVPVELRLTVEVPLTNVEVVAKPLLDALILPSGVIDIPAPILTPPTVDVVAVVNA